MQGEVHQCQCNHQAGQGVQQVRQALGPNRQMAFIAHHQQPHRHREYQAQCRATQRQRQGGQQRLANFGHRERGRRAYRQPIAEHPQWNAAADDRQRQAIQLPQRRPLAQSNLLRMPRRTLADTHMSTLAAHAQLQPQQRQAHRQQHRRQHRGIGITEFQFELLVDRRGKGLQADDRQRAEFHQHMQRDQQCPGQQ